MSNKFSRRPHSTSWQPVKRWYSRLTSGKGHYFHQHLITPGVIPLLHLSNTSKVLDLGCGSGVLARSLPAEVNYTGVDVSAGLIEEARKQDHNPKHQYLVRDVTRPISLTGFTHAVFVLSLQNMKDQAKAIATAAQSLAPVGILVIVLNHPCFRIPRQSSWEIDPKNKLEYRRLNRYLTPLEVPINAHPGHSRSAITWSFHHPLSDYFKYLNQAGFKVELLEEWTSDKKSAGPHAKMENRSRKEFPLFLAIKAVKS